MGTHGPIPSNTSRYTSADIGLIHMVGLDLNTLDPAQLAWLEADLARANENRTRTPWIMVASHFPLFHSVTSAHANMSAAYVTFRLNFHFLTVLSSICVGIHKSGALPSPVLA